MEGMEEKLNAILGNPQMMQQIMAMAQSMGKSGTEAPKKEEQKQEPAIAAASGIGGLDIGMIQRISSIARQSGIDKNQQNLLKALNPYLSRERIVKLEKAMRAAKIAAVASTALGGSGIPFLSGR